MLCAKEDSLGDFITLTEAMEKRNDWKQEWWWFCNSVLHTHKSQPYNIFEKKKMRKMLKRPTVRPSRKEKEPKEKNDRVIEWGNGRTNTR